MASSLPCVAAPLSSSSCFSSLPRELRGSSLSSSSVRTWTSQNLLDDVWMAIPTEAKNYELGEALYYVVLVGNTITWQFFFLGVIGVIFCASSLFSGIMIAVLLPVTEILAVICFWETFQAEKGVSLALSLWGLASYFNGEFKLAKKEKVRAAAAAAEAD